MQRSSALPGMVLEIPAEVTSDPAPRAECVREVSACGLVLPGHGTSSAYIVFLSSLLLKEQTGTLFGVESG